MSDHSRIEWTDATWNPVRGCTKISPGCAEKLTAALQDSAPLISEKPSRKSILAPI